MAMSNSIKFQYEVHGNVTVVALDASLDDFKGRPEVRDGQEVLTYKERTIKDCRNIDGCIYFHLGKVSDGVMVDLIETFQKLKADKKGWVQSSTLGVKV